MKDRSGLLTEAEAAQYLGGVAPRSLRQWRYERRGPAFVKIEGHVRYRIEDLDAYITAQQEVGVVNLTQVHAVESTADALVRADELDVLMPALVRFAAIRRTSRHALMDRWAAYERAAFEPDIEPPPPPPDEDPDDPPSDPKEQP